MRKPLHFWIVKNQNLEFVDFETFHGKQFLGLDPFGGQKGNLTFFEKPLNPHCLPTKISSHKNFFS